MLIFYRGYPDGFIVFWSSFLVFRIFEALPLPFFHFSDFVCFLLRMLVLMYFIHLLTQNCQWGNVSFCVHTNWPTSSNVWARISVISLTEFKFVMDINFSLHFFLFFFFFSFCLWLAIQVSQSGTFSLASTLKYFAGSYKNTSLSLVGQEGGNHGQSLEGAHSLQLWLSSSFLKNIGYITL